MIPETYSRPVTTVLRQKDANLQGSSPSKVSQVTVRKDGQRTVLHRLQHRRGQTSKYPWYPCLVGIRSYLNPSGVPGVLACMASVEVTVGGESEVEPVNVHLLTEDNLHVNTKII